MPIKLCQKCGLKVFLEEGKTHPDPFYCTRCQASQRAARKAVNPFDQTVIMAEQPSVTPDEDLQVAPMTEAEELAQIAKPPRPADSAEKSRLACPACGGMFSTALPKQPARGKCPRCLRPLIVHPDGKVRPATETGTKAGAGVTGGGTGRVRTQGAAGAATARSKPPAAAGAPAGAGTRRIVKPAPVTEIAAEPAVVEVAAQAQTETDQPAVIEVGSESQIPEVPAAESPANQPAVAAEDAAPPVTPSRSRLRRPGAGRPSAPPPRAAAAAEAESGEAAEAPAGDGAGKITFIVIAACVPVALAVAAFVGHDSPALKDLLEKAGTPYRQGFAKLSGVKVAASPPPADGGGTAKASGETEAKAPAPEGAPAPPAPAPTPVPDTPPPSPETAAPAPDGQASPPAPEPEPETSAPAPAPDAAAPVTERIDVAELMQKYEGKSDVLTRDIEQAVGPLNQTFDPAEQKLVVTAPPDVIARVKAFLDARRQQ